MWLLINERAVLFAAYRPLSMLKNRTCGIQVYVWEPCGLDFMRS